ncbi:hypothetical protein HYC85_007604 [Camellia sinensis]|uniref:adenylate dimethylallyltransferase (ADP/ATP-dependent) n=1 Tax=Camellia sinensis TaxID=4442 RepID=A0A7J7HRV8_CAMSI|nr:hypothetical protein HYC85_007604 [Camellia sinensis]
MSSMITQSFKNKVVFIMGATGTGKSRLSIDLATNFPAEIINSDKIQIYRGLNIVTNKITNLECQEVPHHLLGEFDPDSDFTARDFCHHALIAIEKIVRFGHIPIIVGGSNSFIEALVEDPDFKFRSQYDCCFIWLDVSLPILHSFVSKRVDQMVDAGIVDEVRELFTPEVDYTRGIRRAIGVREMDRYFRVEPEIDNETKEMLLGVAIEEIKANTRKLVHTQLTKIHRLRDKLGWPLHRIDATCVFEKGGEEANYAWEELVAKPSLEVVNEFLKENKNGVVAVKNISSAFVNQHLNGLKVLN